MRFVALVSLALLASGPVQAVERPLKDPEGNLLGLIVECSSCREGSGKTCDMGVMDGFHKGVRCGQCLLESNFGVTVASHYDIRLTGRLLDETGKPLSGKFVQLRMPNTWGVKARTTEQGEFMIRLGATRGRKSSTPAALDLGELTMKQGGKDSMYNMFLLPPDYKPCTAGAKGGKGTPPARKEKEAKKG